MHLVCREKHHNMHKVMRVSDEVEGAGKPALRDIGRSNDATTYRKNVLEAGKVRTSASRTRINSHLADEVIHGSLHTSAPTLQPKGNDQDPEDEGGDETESALPGRFSRQSLKENFREWLREGKMRFPTL